MDNAADYAVEGRVAQELRKQHAPSRGLSSTFPLASSRFAMTQLYEIAPWAFWRVTPPDLDPVETREWLDAFDALVEAEGPDRATFLLKRLLDRARAKRVQAAAGLQHRVQEHDRARGPAAVPGQPRGRAAARLDHPLERARDGRARQPRARGARRAHRELRLGGGPLRGRLQPFLPRRPRRGPRVLPAAFRARRLRARLPRGAA